MTEQKKSQDSHKDSDTNHTQNKPASESKQGEGNKGSENGGNTGGTR